MTFLPVGWLCAQRIRRADAARPALALGALLALHLWSMTLLDQLWEVSLAIVAMMFLLASDAPRVRRLAILIGAPFALLGFIQLAGWRMAPLLGTSPDQLDITARLPVMMATALGLCALLVWSVGIAAPQLPTYGGGIPGRGVEVRPGEGSIVLTGDGAMLLKQVQPQGGEPCSASEALDRLGYTLTG